MTGMGHEERFPPTRLSAGCGFRKETIADLRGTTLSRANLSGAHLDGANFFKAVLDGAVLAGAFLNGAQFLNCAQLAMTKRPASGSRTLALPDPADTRHGSQYRYVSPLKAFSRCLLDFANGRAELIEF